MSKNIYLDAPNVGDKEKRYLNRAIDAGYVSSVGPFVPEFEKKFAGYLNVAKAVSVQNGTAAIHIALYELGIGKGDEVIVPALTFVATVNPVIYLGARPVFVDVDPLTWNIDPAAIKGRITKRTKAVIPVHLYGNPCDMDEIMKLARKNDLYVVEDATESLGAKYRGAHTGTFGDFGCFSFNGNKVMTTGGGGMVTGKDARKVSRIKFLINQSRKGADGLYHSEIGFNYRMTNIEAALGLAQMERLGEFLKKKKALNDIYRQELADVDCVSFQGALEGAENSRWMVCVIFSEGMNVGAVQRGLEREGVPTRRIFMPVVEFPPYQSHRKRDYKNSYAIYERGLCLPSSTLNSAGDVVHVCDMLKKVIRGNREYEKIKR